MTTSDKIDSRTGDLVDRHVGMRIRQRRRDLGLSQQELADAIGLTFQQVQKYESGANRVSASKLWRIGQVLKTPPGHWFEGLPTEDAHEALYDDAAHLLLTDDGQALARAYAKIPRRSARLALIDMARELSGGGGADRTPAGTGRR
jgi:transcriptional regulator with XRE-family HTH domain